MLRSDERPAEPAPEASSKPKARGFSAMEPDLQRQIASKGGQAAHRKGVAHKFTKEEASAAGKLGGKKVASIPGHMAEIGRQSARVRMEGHPAEEGN